MLFTEAEQTQVIKIFYCYAREDKALRDELDKHLGALKRLGQITTWYDRKILPGIEWKREIDIHLNTSDIVLLLVSSHFISSDYCYGIEMRQALERHTAGEAHVIPIILRPVDWKETPIGDLQVLPTDGKPITRWRNRDEAFHSVTQGVREVIEMLQKKRKLASSTVLTEPSEESMSISYTNIDLHVTQQRDTLVEEVYTKLIQPDVTALALTGIAGVGKSTVADLACVYAEKQRYAGKGPFLAQPLWLRINPADTLLSVAEQVFDALRKPLPDFKKLSPQNQARTLFHILNTTKEPRLVVFDQFENLLDWQTGQALPTRPEVSEWLDALNEEACTCHILLTSRLLPRGTHEGTPLYLQEYRIEGLEPSEGVNLLRKRGVSRQQETDDELQKAVLYTRGHPLALTLVASILQMNRSLKIAYLFGDSIYNLQWRESISAHELMSYLYNQQLNDIQRKLLCGFSLFREPVPLEGALFFIRKIPEKQTLEALNVLLRQYLLQAIGEGRYQLHSIIATYAQSRFDKRSEGMNKKALQAAHQKVVSYYLLSAAACPPRGGRKQVSDVSPFIEAIWHRSQAGQWQEAYDLIEQEGLFDDLYRRGGNVTLLELYQLMLPLEKWNQKDFLIAQRIYFCLGSGYRALGQLKQARIYFEQMLQACIEGADFPGQAKALVHLGWTYEDSGDKEKAKEYHERALPIYREIGDRSGEGEALMNLGWNCANREQAKDYYEQALAIHTEIEDRRGKVWTLGKLATIDDELGNKERAIEYRLQVLFLMKEIGETMGVGWTLKHLGQLYRDVDQLDRAQDSLNQSLDVFRSAGDSRGEGWALNSLGRLYIDLRQTELAQKNPEGCIEHLHPHRRSMGQRCSTQ